MPALSRLSNALKVNTLSFHSFLTEGAGGIVLDV